MTNTTATSMTIADIRTAIVAARDEFATQYRFLGFRFAMEEHTVGEVLNQVSRSNINREDERDFPEYGSEEYDQLEELDGLSAYLMDRDDDYLDEFITKHAFRGYRDDYAYTPNSYTPHIYIMGTDELSHSYAEDYGEVILPNPTVVARII